LVVRASAGDLRSALRSPLGLTPARLADDQVHIKQLERGFTTGLQSRYHGPGSKAAGREVHMMQQAARDVRADFLGSPQQLDPYRDQE